MWPVAVAYCHLTTTSLIIIIWSGILILSWNFYDSIQKNIWKCECVFVILILLVWVGRQELWGVRIRTLLLHRRLEMMRWDSMCWWWRSVISSEKSQFQCDCGPAHTWDCDSQPTREAFNIMATQQLRNIFHNLKIFWYEMFLQGNKVEEGQPLVRFTTSHVQLNSNSRHDQNNIVEMTLEKYFLF